MRYLALCFLAVSCASPRAAMVEGAQGMASALRPRVVQELGADRGEPYTVVWSDQFDRPAASVYLDNAEYLVVQDAWGGLSPAAQRFVIAHELVHLHGPKLPFAFSEGLADTIACRLVPELASRIWADHWVVQSRSLLDAEDLLRQGPRSAADEAELRALGFFVCSALTPMEVADLVQTSGHLPPRLLLDPIPRGGTCCVMQ